MKTMVLGNGLTVSPVSLGCVGMTHAYGATYDANEMTKLIHEALSTDYSMFDTAECYIGTFADGSTAYNH